MHDLLAREYVFSGRVARNRLVAQAMETNCAEDGRVALPHIERYRRLAGGAWGVVFVEAISITERHLARRRGLVISRDRLDGFKRLVESFKEIDDRCLLLFQITHSGRLSGDFSRRVKAYDDDTAGVPTLSEAELDEAVDQCTAAAGLARKAGADGVDVKACHGYLGGELMRSENLREDRYGKTAANRARYVATVVSRVKRESPGFLVGSRVSLYEGVRGGCGTSGRDEVIEDLTGMLAAIEVIVDAGADFINVSAGIPAVTPSLTRPVVAGDVNLFHHFRYARAVKERFKNVAVIGSAYSTAQALGPRYGAENIGKGYADLAGFGRQSLADPLFPLKLFSGSGQIDYCTLCGGCSRLLKAQDVVYCTRYDPDRADRRAKAKGTAGT